MRSGRDGSSGEVITVCIVDDHQMVREGLKSVFENTPDIDVVGEADSVASAIPLLERTRPTVALVDVQLGDGTGIDICRALRSMPEVRCLVLTSMAQDDAVIEAVRAGAVGFVLKQIQSDELVSCVRRAADGETLVDQRSARHWRERAASSDGDPLLAALSDQERRVLDLLARGLTNSEIAAEMFLAEKTIKNYVSNLLMKMGMARRAEAAAYAARLEERREQLGPACDVGPIRY